MSVSTAVPVAVGATYDLRVTFGNQVRSKCMVCTRYLPKTSPLVCCSRCRTEYRVDGVHHQVVALAATA